MGISQSFFQPLRVIFKDEDKLLSEYQQARFADIDQCFQILTEDYGLGCMSLNCEDFVDTFDMIFADPEVHFNLWAGSPPKEVVCPQAVLSVLYLVGDKNVSDLPSSTDFKLQKICRVFDIQPPALRLSLAEIGIAFSVVASALCTFTRILIPDKIKRRAVRADSSSLLERLKDNLRVDASGLPLAHLIEWLSVQDDVAAYLSCFSEVRLIGTEQKAVELAVACAIDLFISMSVEKDFPKVSTGQLRYLLIALPGSPASSEEVDLAVKLLDANGETEDGEVYLDEFSSAVTPWLSFSTMDKNGNGAIDQKELRHLLWVSNGTNTREPTPIALRRAFENIDVDGNGHVSRMEWLRYAGEFDPETGTCKFGSSLRELWNKMDTDNSLTISVSEVDELLTEEIMKTVEEMAVDCPDKLMKNFKTLARNVASKAVADMDTDGNGTLEWSDFRSTARVLRGKIAEFETFIRTSLQACQEGDFSFELDEFGKIVIVKRRRVSFHQTVSFGSEVK
uniref:EF-hand domain-containing protein n=1 Tax=Octactis speculum TaxID=3111310 RepID=A0A7S2HX53_9STRA|mmetsp:Transcript_9968/g.13009  ORF Transcript_9968/g.13009 Transcript_9968/m.13009 type:complete len:508 (+) Transcript_9968:119-1642(+)